jgi:hypothetical protein
LGLHLLHLPELVLEKLPLGDILGHADDSEQGPGSIAHREGPIMDPADAAVGPQDPELLVVGPAPLLIAPCFLDAHIVVLVDRIKADVVSCVGALARQAPDFLIGRAHIHDPAPIRIDDPEHLVDVFDYLPELRLALTQRLHGPLPLGDLPAQGTVRGMEFLGALLDPAVKFVVKLP